MLDKFYQKSRYIEYCVAPVKLAPAEDNHLEKMYVGPPLQQVHTFNIYYLERCYIILEHILIFVNVMYRKMALSTNFVKFLITGI